MVVEVMGRNCGYLALSSALATEASYVFLPECPHENTAEWQTKLGARIAFEKAHKKRFHFVIIAEGACNNVGEPIKAASIRDYMEKGLGLDARCVILAHTQRGGNNSAFDRLMSVQLGIDAFYSAKAGMTKSSGETAVVLTLNEGRVVGKPLMDCVQEVSNIEHLFIIFL